MKKRYFVKLFPITGEIKEDDNITSNDMLPPFPVLVSFVAKENNHKNQISYYNNGNFTKMSLFLCDTEIPKQQLGNRVFHKKCGWGKVASYILGDIVHITFDNTDYEYSGENFSCVDLRKNELTFIVGEISTGANWIQKNNQFDEDEIKFVWGSKVRKEFRNGKKEHVLLFEGEIPNEENIEDDAHYWAEHIDSSGSNYGYTIYWNEEPVFLSHIKIKCPTCKKFH